MDDGVSFGSREYLIFLAALAFGRGMDFLSTWLGTPNLVLEANPLAKWMRWRIALVVNVALIVIVAHWLLPTVIITTTSLLVAARNFQNVWLMRQLGEEGYRCWHIERMRSGSPGWLIFCLLAQATLVGSIGGVLMSFSTVNDQLLLVPFGIGMGIVTYAIAVLFYSLLSVWRLHRALR